MPKRILLLGIALVLLLGSGGFLWERREALEADLRLEAMRQLSLEQVMGVNPEFQGRNVTLRGKVVSEEEKARAAAVIRKIEGVGEVTNTLAIGPRHEPVPLRYFLDVAWTEESVNVWARVPDDGTKALLLESSGEGFGPEQLIDRVEVVPDLGAGEWLAGIAPFVPEMISRVTPGRFKTGGEKIVLAGFVPDEETSQAVEEAAKKALPGSEVDSYLKVGTPEEAPDEGE